MLGCYFHEERNAISFCYRCRIGLCKDCYDHNHKGLCSECYQTVGKDFNYFRETKYQSENIVDQSPFGLIISDGEFIQYAEDIALSILKLSPSEILNNNLFDLINPSTTLPNDLNEGFLQRNNKEKIFFEYRHFPIIYNSNKLIITIIRDIVHKVRFEKLSSINEKYSLMCQLAGGIAHEIRNPLTSIKGFIQILQGQFDNLYYQNYFDIMLEEIQRIDIIATELLSLSHPHDKNEIKNINVYKLLNGIVTFIKSETNLFNINLSLNYHDPAPMYITCNENEIKQVIINLLKNSIDAMHGGGSISVDIRKKEDLVFIQIQDEGVGIPQDQLNRIYEPFFTTKKTGTGLGLAICNRIIKSYSGIMNITSKINLGTCVEIYFPLSSYKK